MEEKKILCMATDPVYIGTGGYTIGRVDNTIVRDTVTRIPKIPGTTVAGTWRYYMALKLHSYFKEEYRLDRSARKAKKIDELFNENKEWVKLQENVWAAMNCAGQDEAPNSPVAEVAEGAVGHCGKCIVCKSFGYSKNNDSRQGQVFFSDLIILFFPVYTRYGAYWITSPSMLEEAGLDVPTIPNWNWDEAVPIHRVHRDLEKESYINLGWLNLKIHHNSDEIIKIFDSIFGDKVAIQGFPNSLAKHKKIILVSDELAPQIINANLEVRTSVSIDPLTGAAREGALFTSEAIPRGTLFCGTIRVIERRMGISSSYVWEALAESKIYYESLGIGGMVTRGYGRLKVNVYS